MVTVRLLPVISFIIPAHDEEASIVAAVDSIVASASGHDFEVIVVDDASTDHTAALAEAAGAKVVTVAVRQIAGARNAGAKAARGDLFVFVDADTCITQSVIVDVLAAVAKGAVGGGAMVRFDHPMPIWARLIVPMMTRAYLAMKLAAGCFVFATRDAFEAVGGFDLKLFAGEELEFSQSVKRYAKSVGIARGQKARFVIVRSHVETSARKLRTHSGLHMLGQLLRIVSLGRRGLSARNHLSFWYGPRVQDPVSRDTGGAPSDIGSSRH